MTSKEAEPERPSYSFHLARHILDTFLGENEVLTPEQLESSRAIGIEAQDMWDSPQVEIHGRTMQGKAITERLLRSPTNSAFYLTTEDAAGTQLSRMQIPRYGVDPLERLFGESLIMKELTRIAVEAEMDEEAMQTSEQTHEVA